MLKMTMLQQMKLLRLMKKTYLPLLSKKYPEQRLYSMMKYWKFSLKRLER